MSLHSAGYHRNLVVVRMAERCAFVDREEELHEVARRTREVLGLRRYGLRATPP